MQFFANLSLSSWVRFWQVFISYDNASLNPHEYFKVGVQAYCGPIDCYANLCELT